VKTNWSKYIKIGPNAFMQRGRAFLNGLVNSSDQRDDLTAPLTAQPQTMQPTQALAAAPATAVPVKEAVAVSVALTVAAPATAPASIKKAVTQMTAAQVALRIKQMQAAYQPSLLSVQDQESLLPARSIEMAKNYEGASGNRVLPTTRAMTAEQRRQALCDAASPDVRRILVNSGEIAAPMTDAVKRIIANTRPSTLSAEDQQALLSPTVVRILANYATASGINRLPSERMGD
jgi:hypothetical protein